MHCAFLAGKRPWSSRSWRSNQASGIGGQPPPNKMLHMTRRGIGNNRKGYVRILLTNDDGVYAPGLKALRAELQKLGEVTVVAPATEQSAAGHSVTITTPLIVQEVLDEANRPMGWAVEGRPADCVKL